MAIEVAALSIIDRLIQLLTLRERNREKEFNNFIDPLYRDAEPVAKDYMAIFTELAHRLEKASNVDEVIAWLEERRAAYQPVRMKLRALLTDPSLIEASRAKDPEPLLRFTKGLWGLMKGGALLVENTADEDRATLVEYGYGDHAILTVLEFIRGGRWKGVTAEQRSLLLAKVHLQRRAIEAAWSDVVGAYAALKRQFL
jgi:hypothetical protein